jgi:uncharacterized protein YceK
MSRRLGAVLLTVATVWFSGCGTICNFASGDPEVPFGGVQKDLKYFQTPRSEGPSGETAAKAALILLPAELCLSFIADTLTMPLAICLRQDHKVEKPEQPPEEH